jgi:RND family efflux transporter MFP subunit
MGTKHGKAPVHPESSKVQGSTRPALTVTLIAPQSVEWVGKLAANGSIAAWQEAVIGAEISNERLTEVLVNVGDTVKTGQLLARISSDTVAAELAQSKAAVAEAEAALAEANANAVRARQFKSSGFMSAQQINQYLTAELKARAQLNAAQARHQADEVRFSKTYVRAPDAGTISARTATLGSLSQPGQELFRLIRGSRLEWRAEVNSASLTKINPGMVATLTTADGTRVQGRVRMAAPTVDPQTLNGLVYVDLPVSATGSTLRAGTFARGEFELGHTLALALPQSAVLFRDGFSYVYRLRDGNKVAESKVTVGRRNGDQIEIIGGIESGTQVVASGAGFLTDGDTVRVIRAPAESGPSQQ